MTNQYLPIPSAPETGRLFNMGLILLALPNPHIKVLGGICIVGDMVLTAFDEFEMRRNGSAAGSTQ